MNFITLITASYLIGTIPFGLLISRAKGVDIRAHGSGNIGATNVFRVVGKGWGLLCFALDFAKGGLTAGLLPGLFLDAAGHTAWPQASLLAGAAAIVGHNWPVWLKFKGGKGIATSGGVIAAVAPWAMLAGLLVWLATMLATRIVSISSMLAAVAVAVTGWLVYSENPWLGGVLTFLAVIAIVRHRSNIAKLLKGEEYAFGSKKGTTEGADGHG